MAEQNERKLYDLKVDSEFRDLIPPLSAEELKLLEDSIAANGCESPIIVWNGAIVDGHNRYAICRKRGIPFLLHEKEFESRDAAMLWMLRNQLSRRNLNSYQKSDLALRLEPLLAEEAKKRKGMRTDLVQNSDRGSETGRTGNKLGKLAGVSHDTIQKVKKLNAINKRQRYMLARSADTEEDCWQALAWAIVIQATIDYRNAFRKLEMHSRDNFYRRRIQALEGFFRSGWFGALCALDGDSLMRQLRREV